MVLDPMSKKEITTIIRTVTGRSIEGGGFSEHPGAPYRADATVWAILALDAMGTQSNLVDSARSRLASEQFEDGRICLAQDQAQTFWPTPLAILAWHGSGVYRKHQERAIHFLLNSTSEYWKKSADAPFAHDTSIKGWPWIEDTFAWVEPTSLSILALSICGYAAHARVQEAVRMLMDRQLSSGGWNYGNTIVYGQELYPQIEGTGMALTALAGQIGQKEIERSLEYLKSQVASCRTPLSLGWALFALGAWGKRPIAARRWIADCLSRQKIFGPYRTSLLSLLLLAYEAKRGFLESID
jgi:hypothetical protein